jgi:ATP-binding protein involved in chromosome partitioning
MVQNMSTFTCPNCNHTEDIFGCDGVRREAERMKINMLGDIPLTRQICTDSDNGKPTVVADPSSKLSLAYLGIAESVLESLNKQEDHVQT